MTNRIIPSFIQELLEAGVNVALTKDSFIVDGFYKSGSVEITCFGESNWCAVARYQQKTDIEDIKDIVALNYEWWQNSKERFEGWSQPDSRWVDLLLKYEYITAEVVPSKTVYK
jgi:hypothetical protein